MGEWYYIGHYGQLGPLTREQIDELIVGEVISRTTYVWKVGMSDWVPAGQVTELIVFFDDRVPESTPPPPPGRPFSDPAAPHPAPPIFQPAQVNVYASYPPTFVTIRSDKSRVLAGVLQLLIPGVGRMYLGYGAIGVLQLVFTSCGVGWFWSFCDGVYILAGGLKMDGYGRYLGQ